MLDSDEMFDADEGDVHPNQKDWVKKVVYPSLLSGITGGTVLGGACGWVLCPPHVQPGGTVGSALTGLIIGFLITWIGSLLLWVGNKVLSFFW
jgi:hypothetical protein